MSRVSAGILLYRAGLEVLLVHPGGPFWARKDLGAWSIPKGEVEPGEELVAAARREFAEELGVAAPGGEPLSLGEVTLKSGKRVVGFGLEGDLDPALVRSNELEIKIRGRTLMVPEVDRAEWFDPGVAAEKLNPAQVPLLDALVREFA